MNTTTDQPINPFNQLSFDLEEIEPMQAPQSAQQLPVLPETEARATLSHAASQLITRDQLAYLPTPVGTDTWKPVAFSAIVSELTQQLSNRGIVIRREQLAVSHDAMKLFATFDLNHGSNLEYGAALGLRSSNNKTMAIEIAVGNRVFVCDNMCFKGDLIALKRKHTSRLNLGTSIYQGLESYFLGLAELTTSIERLKQIPIDTHDAEHMIFSAFDRGILPVRLFHPVIESYRSIKTNGTISHWQLQNCFTLQAHKLPPQRRFRATTEIGQLFNL